MEFGKDKTFVESHPFEQCKSPNQNHRNRSYTILKEKRTLGPTCTCIENK